MIGGNFRLDALQAAILRVKLPYLDIWTEQRKKNATHYNELFEQAGLPAELLTTPTRKSNDHIFNQYVIRTSKRDALREYLHRHHIGTEIYYPKPLHLQKCFTYLDYRQGSFPISEQACDQVLALPIYAELGKARIQRIVDHVVEFLRR